MTTNYVWVKRKKKKWTITELADKAKIPAPVLSMIESGEVIPNDRIKFLIARALGTKVERLFPKEIFTEKLKGGRLARLPVPSKRRANGKRNKKFRRRRKK